MNIHLVGSLGLPDVETALSAVAEQCGSRCRRLPDGEPDVRSGWLRWQEAHLRRNPAVTGVEVSEAIPGFIKRDTVPRTFFRLADGAAPETLAFPDLGYAREAASSYGCFARIQAAGGIAPDARFQVSLPTAVGLACALFVPESRAAAETAFGHALRRELAAIARVVPAARLAIQWDAVFEIIGCALGTGLHYPDPFAGSVARLVELCGWADPGAQVGIHFCYGDAGGRHAVEPEDLGWAVRFVAAIRGELGRPLDFVHMPVPADRRDLAYFAPLAGLDLAGTALALGLVHDSDGFEGSAARIAVARACVREFDIATECGFGRRDPASVVPLLALHRRLCEAFA